MVLLKTARLTLRSMGRNDAAMVVAWRNMPHVQSVSFNQMNGCFSVEGHLKWFFATRKDRYDVIIVVSAEQRPIGALSFSRCSMPGFMNCWELGKYIGELDAQGMGYAQEATRAWLDYGFDELEFDAVVALTKKDNVANIAINEKMGFEECLGRLDGREFSCDWLLMCLSKDVWLRKSI